MIYLKLYQQHTKIVIAIGDYLMKRNVHWIIIQHYLLVHLYIQTMKNLKRI